MRPFCTTGYDHIAPVHMSAVLKYSRLSRNSGVNSGLGTNAPASTGAFGLEMSTARRPPPYQGTSATSGNTVWLCDVNVPLSFFDDSQSFSRSLNSPPVSCGAFSTEMSTIRSQPNGQPLVATPGVKTPA